MTPYLPAIIVLELASITFAIVFRYNLNGNRLLDAVSSGVMQISAIALSVDHPRTSQIILAVSSIILAYSITFLQPKIVSYSRRAFHGRRNKSK